MRLIVENLGGSGGITSLTHYATRLRFELGDVSRISEDKIDKVPGVLGAAHQGDSHYQVTCGDGVESMYTAIKHLPEMKGVGAVATKSDVGVKRGARPKAHGKYAWVDNFSEYLSDSFRPISGVLLGASLVVTIATILDGFNVVGFRAEGKSATWVFVGTIWRSVFRFLPITVVYNAAKKLQADSWLGVAIMIVLITSELISLQDTERFSDTIKTINEKLGTKNFTANIFGLPMQLNGYDGQVFVPLIMAVILVAIYHDLEEIFPENVQMVFVSFISMLIMIPLTTLLIGPLGIWLGSGISSSLAWMNSNASFVSAVLIPTLYPFLVLLSLHWPLNAPMLVNVQTFGYNFIQGLMGTWNFACFGAAAGVLVLSVRDHDTQMHQTAAGTLAAGLFGSIPESSFYGIHLRFKRVYSHMLLGCSVGGLTITILSAPYGDMTTNAFVFTSLIITVVFKSIWVYLISITVAFFVAMFAIVLTDYYTPEEKVEVVHTAELDGEPSNDTPCASSNSDSALAEVSNDDGANVETATPAAVAAGIGGVAAAVDIKPVQVQTPVAGEAVSLAEAGDAVFASGALGDGVGTEPTSSTVVAPVSGTLMTMAKTGRALGIKTDDGVEVLVHVGIGTVKTAGEGFDVQVSKKQRVEAGDVPAEVGFDKVKEAGYPITTSITVISTKKLNKVSPVTGVFVQAGDVVIKIQP